ncbi:hypothetical protein Tco_0571803 [Tanacetum coccineum]
MAIFEVLDELMEITDSTKLHKHMRFWFVQEIAKEEGFLKFLHDRCDDMRRRSARRHVLIGEMEALGARGVAVDSLDCLKQIQARETGKLAALIEVLAETQAGVHEKDGHISEEEGFLNFLRDHCDDLRRCSARLRVLIGEMEALGARGVAVDSLDCLNKKLVEKLVSLPL